MKKILPLILLFIGMGAGVGAGIYLRPEAPEIPAEMAEKDKDPEHQEAKTEKEETDDHATTNEYVKLQNQFVVPIVADERVSALIVLALSIEVPAGEKDKIYAREPKLRDSFLQILFDHANIGGFDGNFTDAKTLGRLRMALKEVAQKDLGKDLVKDVLIGEIARQDY